jgi:hypothetical protein|nr:MAG TPA: Dec protein, OB-Fold, Decoration, VIRAL PROTEIN [Caudoviricetes sp.]
MNFATIKTVHDDGVTLAFDDGSESQKHYKVNSGVVFNAGDRVRILEDNGTYVVEYVVGNPIKSISAGTSSTADKLKTARQIKLTGDVEGTATFDGSANISISITSLRTAKLKNAFAPNDKTKDIQLWAQYNNALWYQVGTGTRTKLTNG